MKFLLFQGVSSDAKEHIGTISFKGSTTDAEEARELLTLVQWDDNPFEFGYVIVVQPSLVAILCEAVHELEEAISYDSSYLPKGNEYDTI